MEGKSGRKESALRFHNWEDLKTYFKAVRWEAVRLVDLVQSRGKWRAVVSTLILRRLMSYIYIYIYIYIYGAPILDVSRPHTTTQHSR